MAKRPYTNMSVKFTVPVLFPLSLELQANAYHCFEYVARHLKTALLFTWSDYKTVFMPVVCSKSLSINLL